LEVDGIPVIKTAREAVDGFLSAWEAEFPGCVFERPCEAAGEPGISSLAAIIVHSCQQGIGISIKVERGFKQTDGVNP
jgi:hypothetical protein